MLKIMPAAFISLAALSFSLLNNFTTRTIPPSLAAAANLSAQDKSALPQQTLNENKRKSTASNSSVDSMDRANPQRTGVFRAKGISQPGGLDWTSPKVFTIERYKERSWGDWFNFGSRLYFFGGTEVDSNGQDYSDPVLADGIIYFSFQNQFKAESFLYAVDAATGNLRWVIKKEKGWFSPPSVAGGTVFVGADRGLFYALDPLTKKVRWSSSSGDDAMADTSPLIANGKVYFGGSNGFFYALDVNTGEAKWTFKTGQSYILSDPALSGEIIYFSTEPSYLFALDAETGRERWRLKTKDSAGALTLAGDYLYYLDYDGRIQMVNALNGELLPLRNKDERAGTPLAIDGQTIYFGGWRYGNVFAVDALTLQRKWKFKTASFCSPPLIAEGVVYCTCEDKKLYAIDAQTGILRWVTKAYKSSLSTPIIADGAIYFISDDGHLYAVR